MTQFCLTASPQGRKELPEDQNRERTLLRSGVAGEVLADVRAEDAVAAYKAYAAGFAQLRKVNVSIEAEIFQELASLRNAVRRNELEVVGLVTEDYFKVEKDGMLDLMFSGEVNDSASIEYLLVVQADSKIRSVRDLKNMRLIEWSGAKMSLAHTWLDVVLMKEGFSATEEFFSTVESSGKLFKVVLPVFFGQADACLVSKDGYKTMTDLNPQLGRALRILNASDGVVPFVTCLRSSFQGSMRDETISAYLEAHNSTEGRQVLTLFKIDRVIPCMPSDLESARSLANRHRELLEKRGLEIGISAGEHLEPLLRLQDRERR